MPKRVSVSKEEIVFRIREFYASKKRSPYQREISQFGISKKRVITLFGSWNKMLCYADIPLNRNPPRLTKCAACGKKFLRQVKELRRCVNHFCSSACNAQFYTTGRSHSEETKQKISRSLKAHRLFL